MAKLKVQGKDISYYRGRAEDYISLTDMVKDIDNGLALIEKWLRNKNTIEFLGIWEEIYNPDFNSPEFEGIKNQAGRYGGRRHFGSLCKPALDMVTPWDLGFCRWHRWVHE